MSSDPYYTDPVPQQPEKKNKTLIIVIIVVAVLLLCCCLAIGAAWVFGDPILQMIEDIMWELGMVLPLWG